MERKRDLEKKELFISKDLRDLWLEFIYLTKTKICGANMGYIFVCGNII